MLVKLDKTGYDKYLDYLKGVAIIMVLFNHGALNLANEALYPLWIFEAVPLFLLIQVFHVYKKDTARYPSLTKLWDRILKPFFYTQIVFIAYGIFAFFKRDASIHDYLVNMVLSGGGGPGAYYIWIYLQFAFLLPLCFKWVRSKYALAIFIVTSIGIEIFCSFIHMPDPVYRLLCLRYLFLIYLGYLWAADGIVLNTKTFLLSCVSIISILFLHYGYEYACYSNLEPIVFDTSWRTFHWFTYFLPWALLPYLIHALYRRMNNNKLSQLIVLTGKRSYEIFLFQMIVFGLFPINDYIKIIICFLPLLYFEYHQLKEIFTSKENKEVSNQ